MELKEVVMHGFTRLFKEREADRNELREYMINQDENMLQIRSMYEDLRRDYLLMRVDYTILKNRLGIEDEA